jgi:hypothetical protein
MGHRFKAWLWSHAPLSNTIKHSVPVFLPRPTISWLMLVRTAGAAPLAVRPHFADPTINKWRFLHHCARITTTSMPGPPNTKTFPSISTSTIIHPSLTSRNQRPHPSPRPRRPTASFTNLARQLSLPRNSMPIPSSPDSSPFDLGGFHWGDDIIFDQASGNMDFDTGFKSIRIIKEDVIQKGWSKSVDISRGKSHSSASGRAGWLPSLPHHHYQRARWCHIPRRPATTIRLHYCCWKSKDTRARTRTILKHTHHTIPQ